MTIRRFVIDPDGGLMLAAIDIRTAVFQTAVLEPAEGEITELLAGRGPPASVTFPISAGPPRRRSAPSASINRPVSPKGLGQGVPHVERTRTNSVRPSDQGRPPLMLSALKRLLPLTMLAFSLAAPATASAAVDWAADAEKPWSEEWASSSCETSSRVSRVISPTSQGLNAYRLELRDGDDSYGERCELGQANPPRSGFPLFEEGEERWIAFQVRLPDDYPVETSRWNVFHQLKQIGGMGTPALSMEVRDGKFHLMNSSNNGESCCTTTRWSGPAERHRWVKFNLHVKFSPNPAVGFVELYGDLDGSGQKLLMQKTNTHTMKRDGSGDAVPSHSRIGMYRDSSVSGTSHIYFDGYTVATDRASAERRAYAGASTSRPPAAPLSKPVLSLRARGAAPRPPGAPRTLWQYRVKGRYQDARGRSPVVTVQVLRRGRWVTVGRRQTTGEGYFRFGRVLRGAVRSAAPVRQVRAIIPRRVKSNTVSAPLGWPRHAWLG